MDFPKSCALLIVSLAYCAPCLAGGIAQNTTIQELAIHKIHGNFVFIRVAATPTTPPACSGNGYWQFTLPLTNPGDRELYTMLLAAHAAGKTVTLTGTGACNEYGIIESLSSINVL